MGERHGVVEGLSQALCSVSENHRILLANPQGEVQSSPRQALSSELLHAFSLQEDF